MVYVEVFRTWIEAVAEHEDVAEVLDHEEGELVIEGGPEWKWPIHELGAGAEKESPNIIHFQYTYYMVQNTPTRMTHEGLSTAILSWDLIAPLYTLRIY